MARTRQSRRAARLSHLFIFLLPLWGCESKTDTADTPTSQETTHQVTTDQPVAGEVETVMRTASDWLLAQPRFQVDVVSYLKLTTRGQDEEVHQRHHCTVARPGEFAVRSVPIEQATSHVLSNDMLASYAPGTNRYSHHGVTSDGADALLVEELALPTLGLPFLTFLIAQSPYDNIVDGVIESAYVGRETLREKPCHRIRLRQQSLTWEMWIEEGSTPWIHRIEPDASQSLPPEIENVELAIDFESWSTDPEIGADTFRLDPPDGSQHVATILDPPPHRLDGHDAPRFQTTLRTGEPVSLERHVGRDVVVLDFWATWCGPCRQFLPIVAQTTREYADRGVVFYAVNMQETPEVIAEFLDSQQLDLPVALDSDGAIARQYEAYSIPQTVVIGKDGRVANVHAGGSLNLETVLRAELEFQLRQ